MALIFPLSKGVSIKLLKKMGVFDRELSYLVGLAKELKCPLILLDNGYAPEVFRTSRIDGDRYMIISLGSRLNFFSMIRLVFALIYLAKLENKIVRVNQLTGAPLGLLVAIVLRCKFILRMGYSPQITHKVGFLVVLRNMIFDFLLLASTQKAFLILVTTDKIKTLIEKKWYFRVKHKIHIVPNYVPDYFFAYKGKKKKNIQTSFVFVGRLSPEKRVLELISSFKGLESSLTIVGDGPLKQQVSDDCKCCENISYVGSVKNETLPSIVSRADFIILPSFYEGHPKVISEAAALGVSSVLSFEVASLFPEAIQFSLVLPKDENDWSRFFDSVDASQASALKNSCLSFSRELNQKSIIQKEANLIQKY